MVCKVLKHRNMEEIKNSVFSPECGYLENICFDLKMEEYMYVVP